jgi:signal transduction histidine kinase
MSGEQPERADCRTVAPDDSWMRRVWAMWHAAFVLLVLVIVVIMTADHDGPVCYALLSVVCAAYAGPFRPALGPGHSASGVWYLVIVIPATLALGYLDSSALLILYAVFPHIFGVLEGRRSRLLAIAVLALGSIAVSLHQEDLGPAVLNVCSAALISLMLATFTQITLREAGRRGELIHQLEAVRADLDEAHRQAGILAERERLSHEIHDTLAQGFTSLLMLVQAADSTAETDPATTRERLALAERTARENLAEARSLVAALAPAPLRDTPVGTAIERITARCAEETGIAAEVRVLGTPRELPADVQVVLVRAAQESLANVRKHAAASSVCVRLDYRRQGVLLEVVDDGSGFSGPGASGANASSINASGAGAPGGYGLLGMRARVEQVSGTLEVVSAPGAGTTVRVEIP